MSDTFQIAVHLDGKTEGVLRGLNEKLAQVLWSALRDANQETGDISVTMKGDERRQETFHGFARGDFVQVRHDAFTDEHDEVWLLRRGRKGLVLREVEGRVMVDLDPCPNDFSWDRMPVGFHPDNLELLP